MASASSSVIKDAKVLMVGAGGIGCELLKTLALSGFSDIHIIDMDTIEVSNLNRQFLFRQSHVGQSKAKVARDAVLKFRPKINITSYHANVKDPDFDVDFFKEFNVVLNGLDNLDARRHVNRLCLAADVPLVESGTTGFLGQVTVHVKGRTECYECQPKPAPKTYPVCTITSTPSKFVHCIVWAKELLFSKLFGDKNQDNDLNVRSSDAASSSKNVDDIFEHNNDEDIAQYGRRIFDHVFGYNIELALSNEETWKNRNRPKPIYSKDVLSDDLAKQNGNLDNYNACGDGLSVSAMSSLGMKNPQDVWSLRENSRILLEALRLFFTKRDKEVGNLSFDKDDQLAVEFVTAAANIRAASFGIPLHSLFEAKGIAGNIVHAVATTNAVIAGLIVIEAIKVLKNDVNRYRMTYCLEHPSRNLLLMPVEPFEPNKSCYVCSESPVLLEINTNRSKLKDVVEKIIKAKLGMNLPLIMNASNLLYEAGDIEDDMVAIYDANLEKVLAEFPSPVTDGMVLSGWTTTTETTTFTDCAGCLLTFTNSRFNNDVSLNAIAFLRFCAVRLADGGLVCNKKSSADGSSVVLSNGVSDVQDLTDNDDHVSFWIPLLSGLSKLTSDPRSAIKKSSLEVLFNILKDHGHLFSRTFWNSIFCSVVFPVYNSVCGKRDIPEGHCSSSVSVHTEGGTWDSETSPVAAECLIDLFVTFFDMVRSQLPGVVSVLTGFIRSPVQGPASTGVAGLVRLTGDLGNRLSEEEWKEIFLCLKDAATSTVPGFLKVLRTMSNVEVLKFSHSPDHDLTNDEYDDDNLQTATYVVSRTKNHIAMQLLILQVTTDLYRKHQQSLSADNIKVLIELYSSVALHARQLNRESVVLKKLQKACSILELSAPPVVHFENEAFQNHLNFLQNLHDDHYFMHKEIDLEQELVSVCENVLDIYLNCAGSVSTFHKSDTQPVVRRKLSLSSTKKEEIAARTSLVISALQSLAGLEKDSFRRYIPRFFQLLVDLVRSEHTSGEVQLALSNMFRSSVGPIIME